MHQINTQNPDAPYILVVHDVLNEPSFWKWAKDNQSNVTTMSFDFVAPNMFDGPGEWDENLKKLKDKEKAHKVKVQWSNADGINTDTAGTRNAVEYAQKGQGGFVAKTKDGKTYDSKRYRKTTFIKQAFASLSNAASVLKDKADEVLGRGKDD